MRFGWGGIAQVKRYEEEDEVLKGLMGLRRGMLDF